MTSLLGPGCGKKNNNGPSVFVRPAAFLKFINDTTGECVNQYEH